MAAPGTSQFPDRFTELLETSHVLISSWDKDILSIASSNKESSCPTVHLGHQVHNRNPRGFSRHQIGLLFLIHLHTLDLRFLKSYVHASNSIFLPKNVHHQC